MGNDYMDDDIYPSKPNTWFHSIDLGGEITAGATSMYAQNILSDIYFSIGIDGLSVLDVGAWDGFFSFEAEKRGASRVVAVDKFAWGFGGWGKRAAFEYARDFLKSKVEDRILDLDGTTVENLGTFDVVMYNGIVYHDPDAYHHLRETAKIASQVMTVETAVELMDLPRPAAVFYPAEEAAQGKPENGCGPNSLMMFAWLKSFGFETILEFDRPETNGGRKIYFGFKPGHQFPDFIQEHQDKSKPTVLASK